MHKIIWLFAIFSMLLFPSWGFATDITVKELVEMLSSDSLSPGESIATPDCSCNNYVIAFEAYGIELVKVEYAVSSVAIVKAPKVDLEYQPLQVLG